MTQQVIVGNDVAVRLPRTYDPVRLVEDLEALKDFEGAVQPGPYHDGRWKGVSLYSMGGRPGAHPGRAGLTGYRATDALARMPYLAEILDSLSCPKRVVRLLTLDAGAVIGEHNDAWANFACGTLRLHVPIVTHPSVVFVIDSVPMRWREGELWWGDFSRPHFVRNESPIDRVHLVIDLEIDAFSLGLFPPDFVERRRREPGGIAERALPLPTAPDVLAAHECDFRVPGEVMPLFGDGRPMRELASGARGALRVDGGRLVALLDGVPSFALERIGEARFGIVGQTSGVTVEIRRGAGGRPAQMDLVLRGLPKDLYAAQLGFLQGPPIAVRRVPLPIQGGETS